MVSGFGQYRYLETFIVRNQVTQCLNKMCIFVRFSNEVLGDFVNK